jgi:hypothetical protein
MSTFIEKFIDINKQQLGISGVIELNINNHEFYIKKIANILPSYE